MEAQQVILNVRKVPSYTSFCSLPYVSAVLAHGSVACNKYVDGWSDLDIFVFVDNYSTKLFSSLAILQVELEENLKIKIGIEVIDDRVIRTSMHEGHDVYPIFKMIKNCCIENTSTLNGLLYQRTDYEIPRPSIQLLKKLQPHVYAYDVNYGFNKLFKSPLHLFKKKIILRKLIKYNLYMMQYELLYSYGIYEEDYDRAIARYEKQTGIDGISLKEAFAKRFKWKDLKDSDISDQEIENSSQLYIILLNRLLSL